ncbi:MAG: hypothetical protein JXB47_21550 [Anaerolineae bacterium]|nr:hypothetical protein [Anaerolineae bacterium]
MSVKALGLMNEGMHIPTSQTAIMLPIIGSGGLVDGQWLYGRSLEHGQPVEAIDYYNRHFYAVGDTVVFENFMGVMARVHLCGMRRAKAEQLTDAEIKALGYGSLEEYLNNPAWHIADGWFVKFTHLAPEAKVWINGGAGSSTGA